MAPGGVAFGVDVGEVALIPDVGRQIHQSALLANRYVQRAACAFFETHDDRYDALFFFTSIPMTGLTRSQQGWATRRAAMGIGRDIYRDSTSDYCSAGRLRHAVKMSDIGSFEDDPDAIYTGALGFTLSGVELMGHEFGHQWLAAITYQQAGGPRHCTVRAFQGPEEPPMMEDCDGWRNSDFISHWSHFFNTGSVMYGNVITDLGGGRFELSNPGAKYSELDQYLMGLRGPSEVAPMFLVHTGPPSFESASFPVPRGQPEIIEGERVDLTVDDIIRAEGPRNPPRDICHWKAAFAIIHDENIPPSAAEIARVDAYRRRWETWYAEATDRRGSFDTTLAGTGLGTVECPSSMTPPPPRDAGFAPDAEARDAEPPPDSGVSFEDAAAPIAVDSGSLETPQDAGAVVEPPDEERVKTLVTEDCDCTSTRARSASTPWLAILIALGVWCFSAPSRERRAASEKGARGSEQRSAARCNVSSATTRRPLQPRGGVRSRRRKTPAT